VVGIRVSSCYRLMKPKVEGACWESRDYCISMRLVEREEQIVGGFSLLHMGRCDKVMNIQEGQGWPLLAGESKQTS
jgi:hypothetical protein